ncbi:MAG: diacylglycerol/lipid kinase family protein [Omnitrophica WOR_2 bacterium]
MDQPIHILYNPAADKGRARKILPQVKELLQKYGIGYDLTLTERPGHAVELSRELAEAGCPLVVAAGGDGTVNEVINGLMRANLNGNRPPALGVLPIGRGNDFAYGAGIPSRLPEACETLAHNLRCPIDIGRVVGGDYPQGRYFGNGIGLGFDAVVGFEAARMTHITGFLSYLAAVWNTIFIYSKAPVYEVSYNDQQVQKPFLMVSAMNGRRLGGLFMVTPDGKTSDGMFDVCMTGKISQLGILGVVPKFIKGTQAQHPEVKIERTHKIHIRAVEGTIPAHADGETICTAGHELSIELLPSALEVVTRDNGESV